MCKGKIGIGLPHIFTNISKLQVVQQLSKLTEVLNPLLEVNCKMYKFLTCHHKLSFQMSVLVVMKISMHSNEYPSLRIKSFTIIDLHAGVSTKVN